MTRTMVCLGLGAFALGLGAVPAGAKGGSEPSGEEQRKAQLAQVVDRQPELGSFMERYGNHFSVELIAKVHPVPQVGFSGTTLRAKAQAAQAALLKLGAVVEELKEDTPVGDKPRRFVLDSAEESLGVLGKGFNDYLLPAGADLDKAEGLAQSASGALQVVAATNYQGSNDNCSFFNSLGGGSLFASRALVVLAGAAADRAQAGCGGQQNPQANAQLNQGISQQFDPVISATGRGVSIYSNEELPLVAMAHAYIVMAGKATKRAMTQMSGIFEALDAAEKVKEEMSARAGEYASGMKGSAAGVAQSSAKAVQEVVDTVGAYAAMLYEVGGKADALVNGPLKTAHDKVHECTLQNIAVGKLLQTDAPDEQKAAEVRRGQYKNLAAVSAVEKSAAPFQEFVSMKGGPLTVASLPEGASAGAAPAAKQSPTVDAKGLQKGRSEAQKLSSKEKE